MLTGTFLGYSDFGAAATSKAPAVRLQNALAALGRAAKDTTLLVIKADGAIGAKTVIAVNRALTKHIGSGQASAALRTGKLTLAQVKAQADVIALILEMETKRRGGAPATNKAVATKAVAAKTATKPVAKAAPTKTIAPTSTTTKAQAIRVQKALAALGNKIGDVVLKKIKADGAIGSATAAAVNKAFTKHIGSGQAPTNFRTGKLTPNDVKANATALAGLIEAETMRRGGAAPAKVSTAKIVKKVGAATKVKTATGKTVTMQPVITEDGENAVQTTDEETGETQVSIAPPPPSSVVTAQAKAKAAQTAYDEDAMAPSSSGGSAPGSMVTMPNSEMMPREESEGFFSKYQTPLLIGGGVLALGTIALVVLKRKSSKR